MAAFVKNQGPLGSAKALLGLILATLLVVNAVQGKWQDVDLGAPSTTVSDN